MLLSLALSGCGVKGKLIQAGKPLPAAPSGVTLQQKGDDLLLSWRAPTMNQDGTPLSDLHYFAVFRLPYRAGDYCDECIDPEREPVRIYPDLPAPALLFDNRYYLTDLNLPQDIGYRYRIVPVNRRGERGAEARINRIVYLPPPPPAAFQIKARDRSLHLSWEVETTPAQGKLIGVNIYRAVGDRPFDPQPLNSEPSMENRYDDFNLVNDQSYRYFLRSVIEIDGEPIESNATESISATPKAGF